MHISVMDIPDSIHKESVKQERKISMRLSKLQAGQCLAESGFSTAPKALPKATVQNNPIIRANKQIFRDKDYQSTVQSEERADWASSVRDVTRREKQMLWRPELDPPAHLSQVTVVLVSPRRPVSAGTVARACSAFEVEDMRIVAPRCSHLSRHALGSSKGAQYVLHNTQTHNTIAEATQDCDLTVAFTRWTKGVNIPFYDLAALLEHPTVRELVSAPIRRTGLSQTDGRPATVSDACSSSSSSINEDSSDSAGDRSSSSSLSSSIEGDHHLADRSGCMTSPSSSSSSSSQSHGLRMPGIVRVALVFGREDLGMSDEEVSSCDAVCSIPIGRLQESLSLSHAVSICLSSLFQRRLKHGRAEGETESA